MPLLNFATSIMGYPPHRRSGQSMVGVSYITTHDALRFAAMIGLGKGWMRVSDPQPQLEAFPVGPAVKVDLSSLFDDARIAATQGIVSGSVVFAATKPEDPPPPSDRPLQVWADSLRRPWVEVIDNECAYLAGLEAEHILRLLSWFVCQMPLSLPWRDLSFACDVSKHLMLGLYRHGWTRQIALVHPTSQDLWGGTFSKCFLGHIPAQLVSSVQEGVRLELSGKTWQGIIINDQRCPLSDETGRLDGVR